MGALTGGGGIGLRIVAGVNGHHSQRLQASQIVSGPPSLRLSITSRTQAAVAAGRPQQQNLSTILSDDELAVLDESRIPTRPPVELAEGIALSAARPLAQLGRVKVCVVCEMAFADNE